MAGLSWSIDWDFEKRAVCFNCGADVVQKVKVLPVITTVTCTNCGAERIFNVHGTFATSCDIKTEPRKHKYDVWHFTRNAKCPHCGNMSDHSVTMDEFKSVITCPVCCFTHLYNFSVYTRGRGKPGK
jgi:transcription elongation factor Elf1